MTARQDGVPEASDDPYLAGAVAFRGRDYVRAVEVWRPLAERGNARAQVGLAVCLIVGGFGVGKLVKYDYPQAIEWLRKAAAQGNAEAFFHLAQCTQQGRGVPQDDNTAWELYRQSAELGDAAAQHELAWRYSRGLGVPQDDAVALHWYRRAAEHGLVSAMLNLALMYWSGRGVEKDLVMAKFLYEAGGRKVDDFREPADVGLRLGIRLSAEQKAEAEDLIRDYKPGTALPMHSKTGRP